MAHGASMRAIRPARADDRDVLYEICVRTGSSGSDATGLYRYPSLLGDVFVGPYLELERDLAFVVAANGAAQGYILGCADSSNFAQACERVWWPALRERYASVVVEPGRPDEWLLRWIEAPPPVPSFVQRFPSELHIDLLPEVQGGGWGGRLMSTLFDSLREVGSPGVHLGVAAGNPKAIGFYRHLGFGEIQRDGNTVWMGLEL